MWAAPFDRRWSPRCGGSLVVALETPGKENEALRCCRRRVKTRLGSGLMRRNASEREPASNRRPSVQNGGWLTPTERPTAASFLPFRSFGSQTRRLRSTPPAARVLVGGEIKRKLARGRISGEATRRNKTRKHDRTLVPRSFVVFVSLSTAPVFLATN